MSIESDEKKLLVSQGEFPAHLPGSTQGSALHQRLEGSSANPRNAMHQ